MIWRLRWFYFLAYAGVGAWLSYFAPYLRGLGFSGEAVGAVTTAQQLTAAPASLVWGSIGDRLGSPARALRFCAAGAALTVIALPFARTPLSMGVVLVAMAAFGGGIVPLVDSTTVEAVRGEYARTRLWGSLGFIVSAQAIGFFLAARGERPADPAMPIAYVACIVTYALLAQTFPAVEPRADRPHWRDALSVLRSRPLLFILALCALHWAALSPYHLMFGVLVRDLGLSSRVTGVSTALGVAAEVGALLVFPALEKRFSLRSLFAVSFAATALRWALLARAQSGYSLILLQILHAFTFGTWWGCAVEAMQRTVPARLRATGQAVFSAVVFGAGNAAGFALAGAGYDRLGGVPPLFTCAAVAEALPLLLLLLPLTPERGRA